MIIFEAKNRKQMELKEINITWEGLIEKLRTPVRTAETLAEYQQMDKEKKNDLKDVGGFVGGELIHKSRKNISNRILITLDADSIDKNANFADLVKERCSYSYCIYSTHSHCLDAPRYRLIIPLNRTCSPEEYEAIARKVAEEIGLNYFDQTTYQPQRLMYYPSVSVDAEYIFIQNTTEPLNADQYLAKYSNWKDVTLWPTSTRERKNIHKQLERCRQADPTDKEGIIGEFCKAFNIHDAIATFLNDIYEPCGDKYTYIGGTTTGGLIVKDEGKFSFSFHSSDPTCNRMCNSFDLVRIHLFGHLDGERKYLTQKQPSFKAMFKAAKHVLAVQDFAEVCDKNEDATEKNIKNQKNGFFGKASQNHERGGKVTKIEKAKNRENLDLKNILLSGTEFVATSVAGEEFVAHKKTKWMKNLHKNKKGEIKATVENILIILRNDEELKGKVALSEFTLTEHIIGNLPCVEEENKKGEETRFMEDVDDAKIRAYIEKIYGIDSPKKVEDAVKIVTRENLFHPVRKYFKSLKHDGVKRLDRLFIDYLGAEDNIYVREATRKLFVAMVARIFKPGTKFDYMPILVGEQGIGKSQILKRMGGEWYTDTSINLDNENEAGRQILGFMLIEWSELTSFNKAKSENLKHYLTKTEDRVRHVFEKRYVSLKRQFVCVGTTNNLEFLKDPTGNRRFWPILTCKERITKNMWETLTQSEVDQILAEAVQLYLNGESLLLSDEARQIAEQKQEEHAIHDDLAEKVDNYLDMPVPEDWNSWDTFKRQRYVNEGPYTGTMRNKVTIKEIYEDLGYDLTKTPQHEQRRLKEAILKTKKWQPHNGLAHPRTKQRCKGYKRIENVTT